MEDKEEKNICQQCGGVLNLEWTVTFEQRRPVMVRVTPGPVHKICAGHPTGTESSDWELLNVEQKYAIATLRRTLLDHFIEETSAFRAKHSNVRLEWDFRMDPYLRNKESATDGVPFS